MKKLWHREISKFPKLLQLLDVKSRVLRVSNITKNMHVSVPCDLVETDSQKKVLEKD